MVKNLPAKARDAGLIPGLGRSAGEGNGSSLQYSCLRNTKTEEPDSPWGHKRAGHDLTTKQQKCGAFARDLVFSVP